MKKMIFKNTGRALTKDDFLYFLQQAGLDLNEIEDISWGTESGKIDIKLKKGASSEFYEQISDVVRKMFVTYAVEFEEFEHKKGE